MCINLDSFEVSNLVLGSKSDLPDGSQKNGCFSFYIQDSLIQTINVRLSEFYSEGYSEVETYKGPLIVNNNEIEVNDNFKPEDIIHQFENQTDHRDDGNYLYYQFKIDNIFIEFAWNWHEKNLVPYCISLHID